MPVLEDERLVAVVFVNAAAPRDWSPQDLALMREVAERTHTASSRLRSDIALAASEANAALNGVSVELSDDLEACLAVADRVTAADILYDRDNLPLLDRFRQAGAPVLLADSRIAGLNPPGYRLLGHWHATTWPDLGEANEFNQVRLFLSEPHLLEP